MKGISLPVNIIVVIVIVAIVLLVFSAFFISRSSEQITAADAQRIFSAGCLQLKCSSAHDLCIEMYSGNHDSDFYSRFYNSCNILHGIDLENKFSCFSYCGNCVAKDLTDEQIRYTVDQDRIRSCFGSGDYASCICEGI